MSDTTVSTRRSRHSSSNERSRNPLARMTVGVIRFIKEVIAELRKAIWPTRRELAVYTVVVVVFVAVMVSIVWGLDFGFGKGMLYLFGDLKKK